MVSIKIAKTGLDTTVENAIINMSKRDVCFLAELGAKKIDDSTENS